MIYLKNGGSADAIDHFWGGVEIKLVDFGGVWSHFRKIWVEAQHFIKKVREWGEVGTYPKKCGI